MSQRISMDYTLGNIRNDTIENILKYVNEENVESVSHLDYPFSMMNKDLGVSANVLFAYQGDYFYSGNYKGKLLEITPLLRKDGKEK